MRADELLVLNYGNFSARADAFFENLSRSPSFRELFLKDPAGTMAKTLFTDLPQVSKARINQGNRLLFSLLSNPRFMDWSESFQDRIFERILAAEQAEGPEETIRTFLARLERSEVYREVIEGVGEFGDLETFFSLMVHDIDDWCGTPVPRPPIPLPESMFTFPGRFPHEIADVAVDVETFVYALAVAAVAVVVVAVAVAGRVVEFHFSRFDLQAISGFIAEQMFARAQILRDAGRLINYEAARGGPVL